MNTKTAKRQNKLEVKKKSTKKRGNSFLLPIYLFILVVTFLLTYNHTLDRKVSRAGDNAGYYILGKSLALGKGFLNIHTKEQTQHRHFPPGYPALIALASYFSLDSIVGIKKLNGFFLFASIGLAFLIFYHLSGSYHLSFILSLFMITNYHLLSFASMMMSETSFLFFSLLSLWILLRLDFNQPLKKNWQFVVLIILLGICYYIRSIGISLFAGCLLWALWQKRWRHSLVLLTGFGLLIFPWQWRQMSLGGGSYLRQLMLKNPYDPSMGPMGIVDWLTRFWENFLRYVSREIPSGLLNITNINYQMPIKASEYLIGIVTLALIIVGIRTLFKKHPFILFYVLGTFGIVLLWPQVWFGIRFLLPLIPLLFFTLVTGITTLCDFIAKKYLHIKFTTTITTLIVIVGLLCIKLYADIPLKKLRQMAQQPYPPNYANYFALAKWIKKNTSDSVLIACRKEQLFYLYADRSVTRFKNTSNEEAQLAYLKAKGVNYIVLDQLGFSDTQKYLVPAINKYPRKFKPVAHIKKPDTYLFRFLPDLGYSGGWKDKKRHGKGTFTWEDGKKFVGLWKNHLRNGPGVLYLSSGHYLEGNWRNDKLEGVVMYKTKAGALIEKSIYKNDKKISVLKPQVSQSK